MGNGDKELVWVGDSLEKLREFSEEVKDSVGFALRYAQSGEMHPDAKPLNKGKLKGKGIYEIVEPYDGDTYRAVYTVILKGRVYALHSFKKKSNKGKETPKPDIDLIESRYKKAKEIHCELEAKNSNFIKKYLKKYLGKVMQ